MGNVHMPSLLTQVTLEQANAAAEVHRALFNAVCDQTDWKGPVNAKCGSHRLALKVADAIRFMTGTEPTISLNEVEDCWVVESVGYRAGPCGDH